MNGRGAGLRSLVVAIAAVAAVGLAVFPVQGRIGADVAVIDSNAVAASIGLISRVPAESPGGINWTLTSITLDKAQAKAAGGTGGSLAETFFQSSSDQYRNPSLIGAQYPPTATTPAEARGGAPAGTPGGPAATHVVAGDQPSATAEAQGGRGGDGSPISMQGGSSSSHGELGADGAVVTRAVSSASGVSIGGGAVTIGSATTRAVTTVPGHGQPATDLQVTMTGLLVGGVPAELTDQGLKISDQVPVGPQQLAAFNAALAQLAARGITMTAAPTVRETGANQARAEGGAAVVRYTVTDQIGGDEEVILAQARSRSTLTLNQPADVLPPLPAVTAPPVTSAPPATAAPPPPPAASSGSGDLAAPVPIDEGPATAGSCTPLGRGAGAAGANGGPCAGSGTGDAGPVAAPAAPVAARPALNLFKAADDRALRRLRAGYRVILALAAAGAFIHFAAQRARTS
ncbi:MAG TPA: hypothetical protein VHL53_22080 [Acidimicrobiia bacterium]|nr:hypothetical protein [Acidimicrobiia bacterium]